MYRLSESKKGFAESKSQIKENLEKGIIQQSKQRYILDRSNNLVKQLQTQALQEIFQVLYLSTTLSSISNLPQQQSRNQLSVDRAPIETEAPRLLNLAAVDAISSLKPASLAQAIDKILTNAKSASHQPSLEMLSQDQFCEVALAMIDAGKVPTLSYYLTKKPTYSRATSKVLQAEDAWQRSRSPTLFAKKTTEMLFRRRHPDRVKGKKRVEDTLLSCKFLSR